MTLKHDKADFIQGEDAVAIGVGATVMGFCSKGENGLNSKYRVGKQEFVAKEQGRGPWIGNYSEEVSRGRGTLGKLTQRDSC